MSHVRRGDIIFHVFSQKGHEDLFLIHHKQERGIFMTRIKNIISNQYHQLNLAERGRIEALRDLDWSIRRIAKALHRNPSTISRKLRRGDNNTD